MRSEMDLCFLFFNDTLGKFFDLYMVVLHIKPGCSSELSGMDTTEAQLIQIKVCVILFF